MSRVFSKIVTALLLTTLPFMSVSWPAHAEESPDFRIGDPKMA